MKEIELLKELQDIEVLARKSAEQKARAAALRDEIPEPLLGHYDRLTARGKKGVVMIRKVIGGGVCTGCRMQLPSGVYASLMRDEDITMCDNCARYLLAGPEEAEELPPLKRKVVRTRSKPVATAVPAV
jgi:predicted  nucleic acid-binding Zn-ribbon protein